MNNKEYIPERGDAVWVDMNPQSGHEQSGRRPALILSPGFYNKKAGLALLCPITNQIKGYPFEIVIPQGLNVSGAILSDQIKSFDWKTRRAEFIQGIPERIVLAVLKKIHKLL